MAKKQKHHEPSVRKLPVPGNGLYWICYAANADVSHQAYLEGRTCRNGKVNLQCPECKFSGFVVPEIAPGMTLDEVKLKTSYTVIYPVRGVAIRRSAR